MVKTAALILVLGLAGCTSVPPAPITDPRAVWCETNDPIRLPDVAIAVLPRDEKINILAHNSRGELWCGWKP